MELRDLPSVDELARDVDDPLAVEAARAVIDRAREEIRAGADPGDLRARLDVELAAARAPRLRTDSNRRNSSTPCVSSFFTQERSWRTARGTRITHGNVSVDRKRDG